MGVVPLTGTQQAAVTALESAGRVEAVPNDEQRAKAFIAQAADALADIPNVTRTQNKYNLAYDAAHDVGEAMLAAYGYRTRSGPGQHEAVGRFLAAVFDSPPANSSSRHYEQMRRERNRQRYAARPATAAAAAAAGRAATALHNAARARLSK